MSKANRPLGSFDAIDLYGVARAHGQTSYTLSELAHLTGRARSTVALRVDELLESGLIAHLPDLQASRGRPSSRVSFSPATWGTIAIDIGLAHNLVALLNLNGEIIAESTFAARMANGPEPVLDAAIQAARALLEAQANFRIAAIGIGLPLPVFHRDGRPFNASNLPNWDGFDVPAHVTRQLEVPVLVDNDANLVALGEHALRPEATEMIAVEASTGIGAGIISMGTLLRGAKGTAGAIGHIRVGRGDGVQCICGNEGCLVAMASGPAIAGVLKAHQLEAENVDDVIELARNGDLLAIAAIRRAGNDIGEVLTTCISLFNPSLIAVGGRLVTAGDHLIAGIREVVYTRATPFATEGLSIVRSLEPVRAGLIGAGVMATEFALGQENLRRLMTN